MLHLNMGSIWFVVILSTCLALSTGNTDVVELTTDNFSDIHKNESIWFVQFYTTWSCPNCQKTMIDYEYTATILDGLIKLASFNGNQHPYFCKQLGIYTFPTIKIYGIAEDAVDFLGPPTVETLVGSALTAINRRIEWRRGKKPKTFNRLIVELTDDTFDDIVLNSEATWMVTFYSPACVYSRNFVTHLEDISKTVKGLLTVATIDGVKNGNKSNEYNISKYPVIKLFPRGLKAPKSAAEYSGELLPKPIIAWMTELYTENLPVPYVQQIVNEKAARRACAHKELCIITILPDINICQAGCRHEHLDILHNVSSVYKQQYWGWAWFEAGAQPGIESALSITSHSNEPIVSVVNLLEKSFSIFSGSLNDISQFLEQIMNGTVAQKPVNAFELPKINITELWDGENAQIPQSLDEINDKDEL